MTDTNDGVLLALQEAVAGRYFVERELGRGGMGVVYLARDIALDRMVAIKLLPPELAVSGALRTRFLREARTAAQLSHPHIVPIHAVEEHATVVFFVMGFVDGETLGERVRRSGVLGLSESTRLMQEVAWALSHAHARGVVHRDVKPDNILIERETGRALVTDFGIARAAESRTPAGGVVIGTPQYMSPEQARGDEVDARSDLYSLGATFFFALTGTLPIDAGGSVARRALATQRAPAVASIRGVMPPALALIVDRCLEPTAEQRFASAADLAEALRSVLASRPETPASIRGFLADVDATGSEAGTAATAAIASVAVLGFVFGLDDTISGVVFYTISGVTGALAVARVARLTGEARRLLEDGYGIDSVRRSMAVDERESAEPKRRRRPWRAAAWLAGGVAAAAGFAALTEADIALPLILGAAAGAVVAPTIAIRRAVGDLLGQEAGLRRLLNGRFGSWLFRAAGVGRGARPPVREIAGEPTVVAIARAADRLFDGLPAAQRNGLGDVHGVITRLEAEALSRREGDLQSARGASALAALDALRLDLLRLSTAGVRPGELTDQLAEAEQIGLRIDAQLEANDEATPVP